MILGKKSRQPKNKANTVLRYMGFVVSGLVLFIFLFFNFAQHFLHSPSFYSTWSVDLNEDWRWIREDGSIKNVDMPTNLKVDDGTEVVIYNFLPNEIYDNTYLCLLSESSIEVYLDDELRFSYSNEANPLWGEAVKSRYMLVPLSHTDAEKRVTIVCLESGKHINNGELNSCYLGNFSGILSHWLSENLGQFIAAALLVILSLIVIVAGLILLIIYKHKIPVIMLAYGTLVSGLWVIFDSFLYQILFRNFFVDGPMEYMLVMLMPYFYIRYINYQQERRYEFFHTCCCGLMIVTFVLLTILHFTNISSYQNSMIPLAISLSIDLLVLLGSIFNDVRTGLWKHYKYDVIGFSLLGIGCFIQIAVLNISNDQHGAYPLMFGLYLFLFMGCVDMITRLVNEENEAKHARIANEQKTQFLANMSHEIRTPINAVLGMNEMILRESSDEAVREYAKEIQTAGSNLLELINEILDLSRVEAGKMEIIPSGYYLSETIDFVESMMKLRMQQKELDFKVSLDENLPDELSGDVMRIRQIMINLLNNALKYTEKGSVSFTVSGQMATEAQKREMEIETETFEQKVVLLCFEVTDTGLGIKEEDVPKLFESFERVNMEVNQSVEGSGLGLAIAAKLIHLMKGSIEVDTVFGEGSTFRVILPQIVTGPKTVAERQQEAARQELARKASGEKTEKHFRAPEVRILAVDDNPVNLRVVSGLLKRNEVQIVTVNSGEAALEKIKTAVFDLVLMDHMMPGMDGIEAFHAMQAFWKENGALPIPVIVLTANAITGMKEEYLKEGFTDYLSKPIDPSRLEETLIQYLPEEKLIF